MFKFVIFCSIIGSTLAGSLSIPVSRRSLETDSIVNGEEANIEDIPYQISLTFEGRHNCGGSIYSKDIIVTAAHCLRGREVNDLGVRYGSKFSNRGGKHVKVQKIIIHEKYSRISRTYDIALMRLAEPIVFSEKAQPIQLATVRPKDNTLSKVSGWGTTSYGGYVSDVLLQVTVDILNIPECSSNKYNYGNRIKDTMICAYVPGKDSCQGDSGGPLVVDNALVGVVSWGIGCGWEGYPGVYADVVTLHSWLVKNAESI